MESWSKIQGILYDQETTEELRPTHEKALKLHFGSFEPDYEETLALGDKDLSKIRLITGSIARDKDNNERININFFGKRLSVIKKKKVINDEEKDEEPSYHHEEKKKARDDMFNWIKMDEDHFNDLPGEIEMNRNNTYIEAADKIFGNQYEPKEQEYGINIKEVDSDEEDERLAQTDVKTRKQNLIDNQHKVQRKGKP